MESSEPPLADICKTFCKEVVDDQEEATKKFIFKNFTSTAEEYYCELPLIDFSRLITTTTTGGSHDDLECRREIADAAKDWGFFQIINHGISPHVLATIQREQWKIFRQPFHKKANENIFNLSSSSRGCYRWGNPSATSLEDFSWSEAFHIPLACMPELITDFNISNLRVGEFAEQMSKLAKTIAEILAENLEGCKSSTTFFTENCLANSSYLRMNRYPPCSSFPEVHGLVAHTDSDFLTILHQDNLGGLQLVKDGEWIGVKPNSDALIINIGDLFEAWSNGVYKSIQHRVITNPKAERLSVAYFLCPSYETVIQSYREPSIYKTFSFGEYRQQIQEDVKSAGKKIGLPRFLK